MLYRRREMKVPRASRLWYVMWLSRSKKLTSLKLRPCQIAQRAPKRVKLVHKVWKVVGNWQHCWCWDSQRTNEVSNCTTSSVENRTYLLNVFKAKAMSSDTNLVPPCYHQSVLWCHNNKALKCDLSRTNARLREDPDENIEIIEKAVAYIESKIEELNKKGSWKHYVVGHSLGGSTASCSMVALSDKLEGWDTGIRYLNQLTEKASKKCIIGLHIFLTFSKFSCLALHWCLSRSLIPDLCE